MRHLIRLFFILSILILLFGSKLYSQRIQGAVIGGFNLSQVDGDEIFGFTNFGLNAGLGAVVPLSKNFSFSIETLYSQKGSTQNKQYSETDSLGNELNGAYKLNLDYLEVPILVHYNDRDILMAGLGFSYGRLVSVKEYEHTRKIETTTLNGGPYDRNDFSVVADLRFRVLKKFPRFKANIRYTYSIAKIRTRDFYNTRGEYVSTRDQFNNILSFRLIYMFNEKPPVADTKNNDSGF
ncbi:MAG: PorT family protein [Bacteroidales bacterium]|nr:PorT family protein [Bacteroidales bacterium]